MAFAARACQCGTVDCARYSKAAKIFPLTNRAERTAGKTLVIVATSGERYALPT